MVLCFVADCNNSSNRTAQQHSFFRIPKAQARLYYQISRRADLNREDFVNHSYRNYRICDAHFKPDDIIATSTGGGKRLRRNAVPSRQPYTEVVKTLATSNITIVSFYYYHHHSLVLFCDYYYYYIKSCY